MRSDPLQLIFGGCEPFDQDGFLPDPLCSMHGNAVPMQVKK